MGLKRLGLLAVLVVLGAAAAAAASAATSSSSASNALVFGAASDPVILDGPLVSDGESLRPIDQIFEGLVGLKPGTTQLVPLLATSWTASKNGLTWTFTLRKGVKFHGRHAVQRRGGLLQLQPLVQLPGRRSRAPRVTLLLEHGVRRLRASGGRSPGPDKSLYKGCKAEGSTRSSIMLTRPSSSFLGALALTNFGIASPTALKKYEADAGTVDANGVFHPTGTFGTQHPIGHRPVHAQVVDGRRQARARRATRSYWGAKAEARPGHLPADRRQRGAPAGAADR